jgi:anti-anti-sigma regulatory factor
MLIESLFKNGYQILRIKEDLVYRTDVSEMQKLIDECIQNGLFNIAIAFSPTEHFYTPSIRILVQSHKAISPNGGKLALIAPRDDLVQDISEILKFLGLANEILLLKSEDELSL